MAKDYDGWCAKRPDGSWIRASFQRTRRECWEYMREYCRNAHPSGEVLEFGKRLGVRVVKVRIEEVK